MALASPTLMATSTVLTSSKAGNGGIGGCAGFKWVEIPQIGQQGATSHSRAPPGTRQTPEVKDGQSGVPQSSSNRPMVNDVLSIDPLSGGDVAFVMVTGATPATCWTDSIGSLASAERLVSSN